MFSTFIIKILKKDFVRFDFASLSDTDIIDNLEHFLSKKFDLDDTYLTIMYNTNGASTYLNSTIFNVGYLRESIKEIKKEAIKFYEGK